MPTAIDDILNETPAAAKPGNSASPYDDILSATPSMPKAPRMQPAPRYLSDRPGPAQEYSDTVPSVTQGSAPPAPPRPPLPTGLSQPQTAMGKLRTLTSPDSGASLGQQAAAPNAGDSMNATISARKPGLLETIAAPVREGAIGRAFHISTESAAAREADPSNPLLRFEAMTPKPGVARGAAEFASGLTTPENLAIMGATSGLGALESALGKTALSKLVSLGFSSQMVVDAARQSPEVADAISKGDWSRAAQGLTKMGLGAGMAALGLRHGISNETAPVATDTQIRAAQQPYQEPAPAGPPTPPMNRAQRRATVQPPETGVPENVDRAMTEREAIIGKPREQWTNSDILAADELRREGYSGAPVPPGTPSEAQTAPQPAQRPQRAARPASADPVAQILAETPAAPTPVVPPSEDATPEQPEPAGILETNGGQGLQANAGTTEGVEQAIPEPRPPGNPSWTGKATTIRIPGENRSFQANFAVRELSDVQPSHNPFSFEENPDYQSRNDRNYKDPKNAERIVQQARNFDPAYLVTDSPTASDGPPVIDPNGNVLGGNGRTMTLARVYGENQRGAAAYRAALMNEAPRFGLDPNHIANMRQPVLVREVGTEVPAQEAITDFNKTGTAALTPAERAIADSRRISDSTLDFLQRKIDAGGPDATLRQALEGPGGAQIINRLVDDGIITPQEKGQYTDERGILTEEGKQRTSRLLLGRLFEDSSQFENTPPEIRNKLERVVAPIARLAGRPEWDILPSTREAVMVLQDARAHAIKNLDDLNAQQGMFQATGYSPEAIAIAKKLQEGPRKIAQAFSQYASDESLSRPGQPATMFDSPTRDEAFAAAFGPTLSPQPTQPGFLRSELGTAPADPLGVGKFVRQDLIPQARTIGQGLAHMWDAILKISAPATRGPEARTASLSMREHMADRQRAYDIAQKAMEPAHKAFDRIAGAATGGDANARHQIVQFIDRIERGERDPNPNMDSVARVFRDLLDQRRVAVQDVNPNALRNYIENYFPHIWERPEQAKPIMEQIFQEYMGKRPMSGSTAWKKARSIPFFEEGINRGLVPVSWNPVDLVTQRLVSMDKFVMAHRVFEDLKERGLLQYVSAFDKPPAGYKQINDDIATVYGKPTVTVKEAFDQQLMDRLNALADSLGIEHERKVSIGGKRLGYAEKESGKVVTRFGTPESVLVHEIGHQLEWKYNVSDLLKSRDYPERVKELRALADLRFEGQDAPQSFKRYVRKGDEKMANAIAALVYAPEKFQAAAPNTWDFLRDELWHIPALRPLFEAQRSMTLGTGTAEVPVGGIVTRGRYYAPEPVARVINNHLSPGLRGSEITGPAFRAWMGAANWLNQFQLGFSAFHGGFTSVDAVTSKVALALVQVSHGDISKAAVSLAKAPTSFITQPFGIGDKLIKEWQQPGSQGEGIAALVDAMKSGGWRGKMDKIYGTQITDRMMQAFRAGNVLGGAFRAPFAAVEQASKPVLEWLVPRQKAAVVADLVRYEMERNPGMTHDQLRDVAARAVDSADNRMGQLAYDNLFWNKTLKDLAMASVRSVGWNLGTVRELGGGFVDLRKIPTSQHELTYRASYLMALPVVAGTIGALMQYAMTGKGPEELRDYFFPRSGHLDEHGLPERVSIPSYMKDLYHYAEEPGRTLTSKVHPLLNLVAEMLENRDYYGTQIRNPDDPLVQQAMDTARYVGTAIQPFSVRGFERQSRLGEPLSRRLMNFVGVQPAPTSLNKTAAELLAEKYRQDSQPQGTRTSEMAERAKARAQIERAMRLGQNPVPLIQDAIGKGQITAFDIPRMRVAARLTPLQAAVRSSGLTLAQALNIYDAATPAERQQIQRQVRLKVINARNKPYEWTPKATAQAQTFFGITARPPAALLRPPQSQPQALPAFAKGGIVTSPTVGLLGEKEDEAVVPVLKLAKSRAGRAILRSLPVHRAEAMGEWYTRRHQRKMAASKA